MGQLPARTKRSGGFHQAEPSSRSLPRVAENFYFDIYRLRESGRASKTPVERTPQHPMAEGVGFEPTVPLPVH